MAALWLLPFLPPRRRLTAHTWKVKFLFEKHMEHLLSSSVKTLIAEKKKNSEIRGPEIDRSASEPAQNISQTCEQIDF